MYLYYICIVVLALLCSTTAANPANSVPMKKRSTPVETITTSSEHVRRVDQMITPTGDRYKRSNVGSVGISGPNDLSWFVDVEVGGQTFSVIIDTGSTLMAIPINRCANCDSDTPHPYYTPSSTSNVVNCASSACTYKSCFPNTNACYFNITYLDTSFISGGYYTDVVTLAGLSANAMFGAMYQTYSPRSGFAAPQADGILGLGYNNNAITCAPNCAPPVFDSLLAQNSDIADVFSILLSGDEGVITVGGVDSAFYTGTIQYTPIVANVHYFIAMAGISIGNRALSGFGTRAIVDSGSSYTIFPSAAYNQFKSFLQSQYCSVPLICGARTIFDGYCYTSNQYVSSLPSMTFTFNGAVVTIPSSNYIVGITTTRSDGSTTDIYCLGISSYTEDFTILGDTFMAGTYVVFDRVNSRVGFATGVYSVTAMQNAAVVNVTGADAQPTSSAISTTKPTSVSNGGSTQQPSSPSYSSSDEFTSAADKVASPFIAVLFAVALVFVLF